ncbi:hypothetical protein AB205_0135360 [Aquarana catesbeiana]|uniref:Uncharacterized protein n=1 Tax=Aquarana catesbeiana TaxID=8400 RepID=A0A2G9RI67_AQUCT|nr:hypothetical protein AB205_0135360 [Aquarana catesbeiana]
MTLLCAQYEIELNEVDETINKWYTEHESLTNLPSFLDKEHELREHIEQYTIEIINNKETKFSRNQSTYDMGFAYKWNQSTQSRQPTKTNNRARQNTNTHVSDVCSISPVPSSQSTVYKDIENERVSKKRKGDSNTSFFDNTNYAPASTQEHESPVVHPKTSQPRLNTPHKSIKGIRGTRGSKTMGSMGSLSLPLRLWHLLSNLRRRPVSP